MCRSSTCWRCQPKPQQCAPAGNNRCAVNCDVKHGMPVQNAVRNPSQVHSKLKDADQRAVKQEWSNPDHTKDWPCRAGGCTCKPHTLHDRSPGNLVGAGGQLHNIGCGCRPWQ